MEKIASARELFLKTLTKMGIKYSSSSAEDFIWFDYQTEKYRATFLEHTRKVLIELHYSLHCAWRKCPD